MASGQQEPSSKRADEKNYIVRLKWTKLLSRSVDLRNHEGDVVLLGNRVYFFGLLQHSYFGKILNLRYFSWENFELRLLQRRFAITSTLADSHIYILGGQRDAVTYVDEMILFDPVLKEFSVVQSVKGGIGRRAGMTSVWAPWRREIIYFGGMNLNGYFNDTHAFNVDQMSWQELKIKGTLPEQRASQYAQLVGTKMYICSGFSTDDTGLADIYVVDLRLRRSNSWSKISVTGKVPQGRMSAAFNFVQGIFILFSGYTFMENFKDLVDVLPLESSKWLNSRDGDVEVVGNVPKELNDHAVEQADGLIHFTKGGVYKLEVERGEPKELRLTLLRDAE